MISMKTDYSEEWRTLIDGIQDLNISDTDKKNLKWLYEFIMSVSDTKPPKKFKITKSTIELEF